MAVRIDGNEPWPLYGVAASRALEAQALANAEAGTLMARAGETVARWTLAMAPHAQRITVWCGPGGNGGDGLHAAAWLQRLSRQVQVALTAPPDSLHGPVQAALRVACNAGVRVEPDVTAPTLDDAELHLDALVGLGRARPQGRLLEAAGRLAQVAAQRLAVDGPTGLDLGSGALWDGPAIPARATLALLTLKPGLFTGLGRDLAGAVWFDPLSTPGPATLSVGPSPAPDALLTGGSTLRGTTQAPRQHADHKGTYGDVFAVGGSKGMLGALRLAAGASLAAGAGRVIAIALDPDAPLHDLARPELMWRDASTLGTSARVADRATVVCGCGGGRDIGSVLPLLLSRSGRLVLDADALNHLAHDPQARSMLIARSGRGLATILTPHPLEAARLLGCSGASVQADRLGAATSLSQEFQATIVLKGSGTVICSPGQPPGINSTGNPALATAGSGDVLAGWIAGLWSQHARRHSGPGAQPAADGASGNAAQAHDVACAGVWLHGHAADRWVRSRLTLAGGGTDDRSTPVAIGALPALDLIEQLRLAIDL